MHTYFKQELKDGSFQVQQDRGDGHIRKIDADHTAYNEWLKDNVPEEKAYTEPEVIPPYVPSYEELRRSEYPAIGDQLDAIWKQLDGMELTPDTKIVADKIKAVKDRWPKPAKEQL